jgi:uncharacterized protein YndB with AHSA1/START domain
MIVRRSRLLRASRDDVWEVVADPWHQPRWWPRTVRVESVRRDGWTSVLAAERSGRNIRADWRVESNQQPVQRRWAQEIQGTAFERIFVRNAIEARLERVDGDTQVQLSIEQKVRGFARLAPFMLRRAMKRQLEAALAGLAEVVEK